MNILLCIGCDNYNSMSLLSGAEADAKALYDLLTATGDPYDPGQSILLLSPTLAETRDALNRIFPLSAGIEGVTFFFAGHGAIAGGNFYLCAKDSEGDRLSTSGLAITYLFSIINEFAPSQVNIVIDACSAGGSTFDLGNLIKPEITGSSASSSITFLGACGADQDASENQGHGFLTAELIRCLKGEIEVQRRAPMLDLLEVGVVISPLVQTKNNDQRPLSWGLSLFGGSSFAKNPFYAAQGSPQHFPVPNISPFSQFGSKVRAHSAELWEIHRELPSDLNPRRLLKALASILKGTGSSQEKVALIEGIGVSLSARAVESEDLLAPSLCLSTCLISLLPDIDNPEIQTYLPMALAGLLDRNAQFQATILQSSKQDEHYLLSPYAVAGDLYFLPLRMTHLLGWIGADIVTQRLLPNLRRDLSIVRALVEELVTRYSRSLVAVSDAQAPSLYIFLLACQLQGWSDLAKDVLISLYASFCDRRGNTTRWNTPPEQAVRYILSLTDTSLTPQDWRAASPSNLLPILLLWGSRLGLADGWDLRNLDRLHMNFYLPGNPREFGEQIMDSGSNHNRQIGFGLWKISDFIDQYNAAINEALKDAVFRLHPSGHAQCVLSSLLFPDRVPFFVGETISRNGV